MRFVALQIISGFRGGPKAGNIYVGKSGQVSYTSGSSYPFGILKGRSPDGRYYEPLKKQTISWKRRHGAGANSDVPLRFTPMSDPGALVSNLTYRIYSGGNGVHVHFKDAEKAKISLRHERGGSFMSTDLTKGGKDGAPHLKITLPPRKHRGVQRSVIDVIRRAANQWMKRASKL